MSTNLAYNVVEYDYREDLDPVSGAPRLVAVPTTAKAALAQLPYNVITNILELFQRENLREAWRILRKNDPYDYQIEVVDAIIQSCINGWGWQFVVMQTRQSGKNEESAFIEQYLELYGYFFNVPISGVKFAPVHKPQLTASMDRLEGADTPDSGGLAGSILTRSIWKKSDGYKYHIGPPRDSNKWVFLSLHPTANVASQTAFTLLEGDEAQDLDTNKWERDAQPMGSWNNATTVFYGVAWTKESHIYQAMQQSLAMEERLEAELGYRPRLVFKINADIVKKVNPQYKKAYENQVARLGKDHIAIKTQYDLVFIDSIGRFFSNVQLAQVYANLFRMRVGPELGKVYGFGLDIAGQEEDVTVIGKDESRIGQHKRDAVNLVIGELQRDGTVIPVCLYQWVGKSHTGQRETIKRILKHWGISFGAADATGIGEPLAYYLVEQFPRADIEAYKFKAMGDENKSKLGYLVYNFVASDLLKIPRRPEKDQQQAELWDELRYQLEQLIREAKKQQQINWYVPENATPRYQGHIPHDDLCSGLFLLLKAAYNTKDPERRKAIAGDRRNGP